jgi:hypothetical protein
MPEQIRATAASAQTNLHAVLHLVATGRLRCSQTTRRPAATTVAAIADVLEGGDFYPDEPIAAFAWPLILQAGGLAELAGTRLQLTDRGRAALAKPPLRPATGSRSAHNARKFRAVGRFTLDLPARGPVHVRLKCRCLAFAPGWPARGAACEDEVSVGVLDLGEQFRCVTLVGGVRRGG